MRLSDVTCAASAAFVVRWVTRSIGVQRVNGFPRPENPTVLGPGGQADDRQRRGRTVQRTGKRGSGRKTQAVPVRTVVSRWRAAAGWTAAIFWTAAAIRRVTLTC